MSCGTLAYVAPEVRDSNQVLKLFEHAAPGTVAKTREHFYKLITTEHPSWKDTSKRSKIVHPSNAWSSLQHSPHICRVRVVSLPGLTCCSHFGDETWWMATHQHSQVLKKAYTSQCDIWSLGVPLWTFTSCPVVLVMFFWTRFVCYEGHPINMLQMSMYITLPCPSQKTLLKRFLPSQCQHVVNFVTLWGHCLRVAFWLHALLWLWGGHMSSAAWDPTTSVGFGHGESASGSSASRRVVFFCVFLDFQGADQEHFHRVTRQLALENLDLILDCGQQTCTECNLKALLYNTNQYKTSRNDRYAPVCCWKHENSGSWWRPAASKSTPGTMSWSQKGGAAFLLRVDSRSLSRKSASSQRVIFDDFCF